MVRELSVYGFRGSRTSCGSCLGGIREHSSNGEGLTRDEDLGAFGVEVALGNTRRPVLLKRTFPGDPP